MRCPNCGKENADASAFCFECGTRLKGDPDTPGEAQAAPSTSSTSSAPAGTAPAPEHAGSASEAAAPSAPSAPSPGTAPAAPEAPSAGFPRSTDTGLTHRGEVFGLGYGSDHYAVWDLRKAGEPVVRFEPTAIGWEAAWRRFHELERAHGIPAWRRRSIGWILLHVYIGLIALGFLQGFLLGFVLALAGRDLDQFSSSTSWGLALMVLAGLSAWLLFVFLTRSTAFRWAVFVGLLGAGFAAALVLGLATQPSGT